MSPAAQTICCTSRLLTALRLTWVVALATLAMAGSTTAFGHAVLLGTQPSDGLRLEAPPREILLHFNEPVAPIIVRVVDGSGATVPLAGPVAVRDQVLQVALPAGLADGSYVVSYRVTSADSHPVGGAFLFAVGAASGTAARPDTSDIGWQIAGITLRVAFYISLLAAAGGALFDWLVSDLPKPVRRRLLQSAAVALVAGAASLGIHGAVLANPPLKGLLEFDIWRIGAASTRGLSMAFALPGAGMLLAGFARPNRRALAVLGALLALAGFMVSGHAATTDPVWLMAPAMGLHVLTVAFWIGSLAPLFAILGAQPASSAARAVVRFSRVAVAAVGLLLVAGTVLAVVQVRDPAALTAQGYGLIFSTKLVLVAGLLLLAVYNKRRLTPALERGEAGAAARLRGAIGVEMVVVAGILAVTAMLGVVPPPRTMFGGEHAHPHPHPAGFDHAHHGDGAEEAVSSRGHKAAAHVEAAADGKRHLHLKLTGADGRPMRPLSVSVEISNDSAGVAPIARKLAATGPGEYELRDAPFPFAGIWTVDVDALVSDFEKAVWSFDLTVK
jgi:copper transport protein